MQRIVRKAVPEAVQKVVPEAVQKAVPEVAQKLAWRVVACRVPIWNATV